MVRPVSHGERPLPAATAANIWSGTTAPTGPCSECRGAGQMYPCPPFLPPRWFIGAPDASGQPNVFPYLIGQKFLVKKSLMRNTRVANAASGRERRVSLWSTPRWLFETEYDLLRTYANGNELAALYGFFNQQIAQLNQWYYYDHTDNQVANQIV